MNMSKYFDELILFSIWSLESFQLKIFLSPSFVGMTFNKFLKLSSTLTFAIFIQALSVLKKICQFLNKCLVITVAKVIASVKADLFGIAKTPTLIHCFYFSTHVSTSFIVVSIYALVKK